MLDQQEPAFPAHDRFVHAVLGLLSLCTTWVDALQEERADGERCPDGPLIDVALGVVSLTRTLRATLGAGGDELPAAEPVSSAEPQAALGRGSLLR